MHTFVIGHIYLSIFKINHLTCIDYFQVDQRDVPGIDSAFLAMDTEEGVEVVWNEVQFSEKKDFRNQQVCQLHSSVSPHS